MPARALSNQNGLPDLVPRLHQAKGFADVLAALDAGQSAAIDGAWGSACALTVAGLTAKATTPLLVVLPRIGDVDEFALDVEGFLCESPMVFPAWESLPEEHDMADGVFGGRLRVMKRLTEGEEAPRVIVTSFPALLQPVPSRAEMEQSSRTFRVGQQLDVDTLLRWFVDRGLARVTAIELPGEFCVHGGIVDVFPPDALDPLRMDFFGDELESIRRFDVETQRKIEELQEASISLVSPVSIAADSKGSKSSKGGKTKSTERDASKAAPGLAGECFVDALPGGSWIALVELPELLEEGKRYLERLSNPRGFYSVEATISRCTDFPTVTIAPLAADSMETFCHLSIESIERFTRPKGEIIEELATVVGPRERVLIASHNEGERERLAELFRESRLPVADRVDLCVGSLARGFRMASEGIIVVSDNELFGRTEIRRRSSRRGVESRAIDSFLELNENDLVVHLTHGIAQFRGMKLLDKEGQAEEHLVLEFRGKVHMYVPASLIHLVQKYVGGAKTVPELSKVGTGAWSKKKRKVAEAVTDLAADMIRLQAAREAQVGIAHPEDSHWQREFEAAFPYTETPDQLEAAAAAKGDMERRRPMDRLLCGDVGYGKTEVALRAAFKAIDAGRQVAVLVPTTVLAEQHYRTFTERLAEYPIAVDSLSRFKTKAQQRAVLGRMEAGSVDLVVGTHRLIQKDVRFKDLGLVVIDEEQRFGVAAKERLKELRLEVGVMTLSATPIPRTLHMSLLGIRDISNLETPPLDRMAIVTRVCRFDAELIRQAVVRELNRNGQVYFVHNRVHNIHDVAAQIEQIVPEATVDVGHGQMSGHELEAAMLRFVSGATDVLVCTTIIESGLDIPNANTMFIHRADQYGLADLHQLRGRVGRRNNRAYCYLLLEQGRVVTPNAAKRLKAIEEFSELGAGFKIAMRDLEIRGAGNILGTQQSGHIASVGYELYCQLLDNSVRRLKNEPIREYRHVAIDLPIPAYLPAHYVPPGRPKIEVYRRLSSVRSLDALSELAAELRDRFGPVPEDVARLIALKELQLLAESWQIDDIHLEKDPVQREKRFAVFAYRDERLIRDLQGHCRVPLRIVDGRTAFLPLPRDGQSPDHLLAHLKSVLQPS